MPTTDQDARALTYLAKRLREETHGANRWDEAGIYAIVAKLTGRNLALVVEQVTRHAADVDAKTPGAINRPFTPEAPKANRWEPPKAADQCPHHPGQWATSCGGCVADKHAADETPRPPAAVRPADPTRADDALKASRAALLATRAALCSHGVPRSHCADCGTEDA